MVLVRTTGLVGNSEVMVDYVITPVASEGHHGLHIGIKCERQSKKIRGRVRDVILFVNRRK